MGKGSRQKNLVFFIGPEIWKFFVATKLEGGGGKALVAGPLKKDRYFFAASLRCA